MAVGAGGQGVTVLSEIDGEQAQSLITQHRDQLERSVSAGNQVLDTFKDTLLKRMPNGAQAQEQPADAPNTDDVHDIVNVSAVAPAPAPMSAPMTPPAAAPVPEYAPLAHPFAAAPDFADLDEADLAHTWHPQSFDTIPPRPAAPAASTEVADADPFADREAQQRLAFQTMLARMRDGQLSVEDAEQLLTDAATENTDSFTLPAATHDHNPKSRFGASHP
jgi:hypothetical protein